MTGRDYMPFGKFSVSKMGANALTLDQVKKMQPDYVKWLLGQEGFQQKNPELTAFFLHGEEATATPKEREINDAEPALLDPMPPAFKAFWKRAYGERMRVHGQLNYIAFLRVAVETWKTQEALFEAAGFRLSPSVPEAHKPAMLPPPLGHIPAPNLDPLKQDLSKQNTTDDGRDEEVNF